ncbi:MAG: Fe-S cluster assembly sulfur transfer protein SufU [Acidimicrobiales bacterium]
MADLEDLYREIILDHYRSPRNRGELPTPPALRTEGYNPLCGDEVVVFLQVDDGVIGDIRITGQGCSISQSSASLMSAAVKGKSVAQARDLIRTFKSMMSIHESRLDGKPGGDATESEDFSVDRDSLGELAALQGVVKFPVRIKCATLSWNALAEGLDGVDRGSD